MLCKDSAASIVCAAARITQIAGRCSYSQARGWHTTKLSHRFDLEARSTGALNHPNILAIHDIGTYAKCPYLVAELLSGETLREVAPIDRTGMTTGIQRVRITPDGRQYACSIEQELEELHLAEGLK